MTAQRKVELAIVCLTALLATISISAVLERVGRLALPLDDAYIHLNYARSMAELKPFVYSEGAAPSAGATSLLWPLLLAPFYALGLKGMSLCVAAVGLGFVALALLARETYLLAQHFTSSTLAIAAAALSLAFSGHTWFAASGMEVIPFAAILVRTTRRCLDWLAQGGEQTRSMYLELCGLAFACALMRPEGGAISLLVLSVLLWRPFRRQRSLALPVLCAPIAPYLVIYAVSGDPTPSTAAAKWLFLNPYYADHVGHILLDNIRLLFGTLLDGRVYTSMFLPAGVAPLALLALLAIALSAYRQRSARNAVLLLWLAAGILIPTTYETFLVNRLRYIWPFITPWLIGLVLLAENAVFVLDKLLNCRPATRRWAPLALCSIFVFGLGQKFPSALSDLAESSSAITRQQVSMAEWAKSALPYPARLGINDAGAMGYLSGHQVFDVVGLTTQGEAQYWVMGPGSRFEHYERLSPSERPTHFIVYPEWFAIDALLGRPLAEREVHATILGGHAMIAFEARYDALLSAEEPEARVKTIVDAVDVADLESEGQHHFRVAPSRREHNLVFENGERVDGGRSARQADVFQLNLRGATHLILRLALEQMSTITVLADGAPLGQVHFDAKREWEEAVLELPESLPRGGASISVLAAPGENFASLHYWAVTSASLGSSP